MSEKWNGNLLATCSDTLKVWETSSLIPSSSQTIPTPISTSTPHTKAINSLCWNHINQVLASAGEDGRIVLSHPSGNVLATLPTKEETGAAEVRSVSFSHGSRYLSTGDSKGIVKIWDLKKRDVGLSFQNVGDRTNVVLFGGNGDLVFSAGELGEIHIHSMSTGQTVGNLISTDPKPILSLKSSPFSRNILASSTEDGGVYVWDSITKQLHSSFPHQHTASATSISFSPVHSLLLSSAGLDKRVIFYDINDKKIVKVLPSDAPLKSMIFLDDGVTMVVGSSLGRITLFDLRGSSTPLSSFKGHEPYPVNFIALQNPLKQLSSTSTASIGTSSNNNNTTTTTTTTTNVPNTEKPTPTSTPSTPFLATTIPMLSQLQTTGFPMQTTPSSIPMPSIVERPQIPTLPTRKIPPSGTTTSDISLFSPTKSDIKYKPPPNRLSSTAAPTPTTQINPKTESINTNTNTTSTPLSVTTTSNFLTSSEGHREVLEKAHRALRDLTEGQGQAVNSATLPTPTPLTTVPILPATTNIPQDRQRNTSVPFPSNPSTEQRYKDITNEPMTETSLTKSPSNQRFVHSPLEILPTPTPMETQPTTFLPKQLTIQREKEREKEKEFVGESQAKVIPSLTNNPTQATIEHIARQVTDRVVDISMTNGPTNFSTTTTTTTNTTTPLELQRQIIFSVVEEALQGVRVSIHQDVQNLHLELIRQFQMQQNDLLMMFERYSDRGALLEEIDRLRKENEKLKSKSLY